MATRPARRRRIGVMFDRDRQPEELAAFARTVEEAGADDLWVVEDLGWAGSVSSATIALAVTERIRVGIGIAPAPLRNPALLAMELATLARVYPERFVAGVGHGGREWMAQVGAASPHPLALLGETITAVRSLLRGETVTLHGRAVHLDGVRLVHPPAVPPPVVAGVVRPRSLELSGRLADGTIVAEGHGPAQIASVLEHIEKGRATTPADRPHEVVVFAFHHVDADPDRVRAATAEAVAGQAGWLGIPADDVFLAAGSADTVAERVRSLWDAGGETVVLRPIGADPLGQLRASLAALR
ncbi:LLM class flavin-dependent oxidoreductase [Micromonospora sp. KC723]|uniref:LLM class flavin-dependent oxidoreductase n=1 Tax=Micromonospora sp. KC723 TaxID=2530381 RepID=UPI001050C905|nr:LLM class flavin-dependent oxidoreductase [Micromonospora sp. KC723]